MTEVCLSSTVRSIAIHIIFFILKRRTLQGQLAMSYSTPVTAPRSTLHLM